MIDTHAEVRHQGAFDVPHRLLGSNLHGGQHVDRVDLTSRRCLDADTHHPWQSSKQFLGTRYVQGRRARRAAACTGSGLEDGHCHILSRLEVPRSEHELGQTTGISPDRRFW